MMLRQMKAEFRKLFTVRSTYILTITSLLLIVLFAFYFEGYRGNTESPASELAPTALHEVVANGLGASITFACIIAILFIGHEYRYNTILYTLTINARRTKVLVAKLLSIILFCVGYGILTTLFALACYKFGLSLRDASLPAQEFAVWTEAGRVIFYSAGYALIGVLIAVITRSVVAAISVFFMFPVVIEPLLGLILKDNAKYLPFTALDSTIGASMSQNTLEPNQAMLVSSGYLLVGLIITWILFVRRDANAG